MVGRLVKTPEVVEKDNNKKISHITIAVPRSFKDSNGEYQTDFLNVVLFDQVANEGFTILNNIFINKKIYS